MRRLAIALIHFYQRHISRHLPIVCRYEPSCSAYAVTAYERFGFFWGSWLTTGRLLRCSPWGGRGYDPVPERKPARHGQTVDPLLKNQRR
jgi:putative membrane protein insertion efficiency factor